MKAAIIGTMKGEIDDKRFHMPGVKIAIDCKCGRRVEKDLGRYNYLAYPMVGEPFEEIVYCPDCEAETPVRVQLDVTLTLEGEPTKPAKLTVEELARTLDEAFDADDWGDIDPYLFKVMHDPENHRVDGSAEDVQGLRSTLQRAVDKLNARGGL